MLDLATIEQRHHLGHARWQQLIVQHRAGQLADMEGGDLDLFGVERAIHAGIQEGHRRDHLAYAGPSGLLGVRPVGQDQPPLGGLIGYIPCVANRQPRRLFAGFDHPIHRLAHQQERVRLQARAQATGQRVA